MLLNLILLIVLSTVGIVIGFVFTFFMVLHMIKKKSKEQMEFGYEQAKSFYETYKRKTPSDGQIRAMVDAYNNNKS